MFGTILAGAHARGRGHQDALRLVEQLALPGTRIAVTDAASGAALVRAARSEGADLIVLPAGKGAPRVLHDVSLPVALVPAGYADVADERLRIIGTGFDGGPESRAALRLAERLALEHGATMRVCSVVPLVDWSSSRIDLSPAQYQARVRESLGGRLNEEVQTLDDSVRAAALVVKGDPAHVLADQSRQGIDLLVVGSRGQGPIGRVLFGSVSSRLAESAGCPLLIVPRGAVPGEQTTAAAA